MEVSMTDLSKPQRGRTTRLSSTPAQEPAGMVRIMNFVVLSVRRLLGKEDVARTQNRLSRQRAAVNHPWRAVEIIPGADACKYAQSMVGRRFLCAEAPKLPLLGCLHSMQCACVYKHHVDRRKGPRRADESGVHVYLLARQPYVERRHGSGRRSTDV